MCPSRCPLGTCPGQQLDKAENALLILAEENRTLQETAEQEAVRGDRELEELAGALADLASRLTTEQVWMRGVVVARVSQPCGCLS